MNMSLKVSMRSRVGSLTRVLGVVERRGFVPISMSAVSMGDGCDIDLYMTVQSDRPGEQLLRQLEKNLDVFHLEVLQ